MEYILYCDESSTKGEKYSDFFGGSIVEASKLNAIERELNEKKQSLNINAEVKWTKVTGNYVNKYCELIHLFFDYVRNGDIKVRIMFRKNSDQYRPGEQPIKDERYFKLYYQFIKNSFGFRTDKSITGEYYVHLFLDELPDHSSKANEFKRYLCELPNTQDMRGSGLHIRKRDIGEVKSHDHIILQCTDVILGAMNFRLNELNKVIPEGETRRGKKTIAKEKLYKSILAEIKTVHGDFNIGVSTGRRGRKDPHWTSPYEHWKFIPYRNE